MKFTRFFLLSVIAIFCLPAKSQSTQFPQLGKASIDEVINAMTLEEKAHLLVGVNKTGGVAIIANGAGYTYNIPRLGIPSTAMLDGATGVRIDTLQKMNGITPYCTGYPIATLMAATWNTDLLRRAGNDIANEMRSYDGDILLAPSLNIMRSPLCGRNFEYYSEDPLLAGYMAAAITNGLQEKGAGACIKHYAANNQQSLRHYNDARMTQRTLREIYLRNFEITIRESNPWAVMSSYNRINGIHTQSSRALLTDILRNEWGYNGIVITDWEDPRDTPVQIHAGNDLLMGGTPKQVQDIIESVKNGKLSMNDVDCNVRRVLQYIQKTLHGHGHTPDFSPNLTAHAQTAREIADEGIVLLKNNAQTLPLVSQDSVALYGLGTYKYYANGRGAADVFKRYTVNVKQGLLNANVQINATLDRYYMNYMENEKQLLKETNAPTWKNWFFGYREPQEPDLHPMTMTYRAKDCTKAIITISRNAGESEDRDYKEGDYLLTPTELKLINNVSKAFHANNKPVIVVLNVPGPVDMASWKDTVDAIVMAWQPGQEGGNAIADVLTGKVCPSGKLPMTLACKYEDYPSSKNFPLHYKFDWDELLHPTDSILALKDLGYTNYEEGIYVGYRHFDTFNKPVAYPFGYGLSYTTFAYGKTKARLSADRCTVTVAITNTGKVAGKEVVQLYATAPKGQLDKPAHELKAFAKTRLLQPGETQTVEMTFPVTDLASFDDTRMAWVTDAGQYTLSAGASVADLRTSAHITVKKTIVKEAPTKIVTPKGYNLWREPKKK